MLFFFLECGPKWEYWLQLVLHGTEVIGCLICTEVTVHLKPKWLWLWVWFGCMAVKSDNLGMNYSGPTYKAPKKPHKMLHKILIMLHFWDKTALILRVFVYLFTCLFACVCFKLYYNEFGGAIDSSTWQRVNKNIRIIKHVQAYTKTGAIQFQKSHLLCFCNSNSVFWRNQFCQIEQKGIGRACTGIIFELMNNSAVLWHCRYIIVHMAVFWLRHCAC